MRTWWTVPNLTGPNDDVVDGDEDQLHKEPHEPHHHEPDRRTERHLGKLYTEPEIRPINKIRKSQIRKPRIPISQGLNKSDHIENSKLEKLKEFFLYFTLFFLFFVGLPLRSGLWQRLTRRTLSLANSLRGSNTESMASIFSLFFLLVRWEINLEEEEKKIIGNEMKCTCL